MAEFDEKLNALLSNPQSMAQIMQLAQNLSGTLPNADADAPPSAGSASPVSDSSQDAVPPPFQQAPPPPIHNQSNTTSGSADLLSGLMGNIDPMLIAKLLPLIGELNSSKNSESRQLLYALRPYLPEQRQEKVDRALQLARMIHVGKKFLAGWEE